MKKDRKTVIGYTFRVGYIYRADCTLLISKGPTRWRGNLKGL